jgi:hypothetical protein
MRRPVGLALIALALTLTLAGCTGDTTIDPDAASAWAHETIDVAREGDDVIASWLVAAVPDAAAAETGSEIESGLDEYGARFEQPTTITGLRASCYGGVTMTVTATARVRSSYIGFGDDIVCDEKEHTILAPPSLSGVESITAHASARTPTSGVVIVHGTSAAP